MKNVIKYVLATAALAMAATASATPIVEDYNVGQLVDSMHPMEHTFNITDGANPFQPNFDSIDTLTVTYTLNDDTGQEKYTVVLSGNASATFVPEKKEDGDTVTIKAAQMSLDVDNNVSTSTGGVTLSTGTQNGQADKLVFDEDRELAQLTGKPSLTRAAKGNQKELVITGQEVRALTKTKTLYVRGGVKLVQGTTTTTGDAVYYDDRKNVAYVVGNAVSVDSKSKVTVKAPASGYLEQRTDLGRVRALNSAYKVPAEQFKLRGEK